MKSKELNDLAGEVNREHDSFILKAAKEELQFENDEHPKPVEVKKTVAEEDSQSMPSHSLKGLMQQIEMEETMKEVERPPSASFLQVESTVEAQALVEAQIQATMQIRA